MPASASSSLILIRSRCRREREKEGERVKTMWKARENGEIRQQEQGVVAVAVHEDKSSQYALKWALENLFPRDKPLRLVHVVQMSPSSPPDSRVAGNNDFMVQQEPETQASEVFLPYRCFCTRRQVQFETVTLNNPDVARALIDYVSQGGVETLLLGASSRNGLSRIFKSSDVPSSVLKWASDFCNVYIISKGKVSAMRPASRSAQTVNVAERTQPINHNLNPQADPDMLYDELSLVENDISLLSPERLSTDGNYLSFYENLDKGNFEPLLSSSKTVNPYSVNDLSPSGRQSLSLHNLDNTEEEIIRLKAELNHAMDLYHAACRDAQVAKQKSIELEEWNMKQEQRMKEIEKENARCKAAMEAAQRLAEQEVEKRALKAEIKAMIEADEKQKVLVALGQSQKVIKYQSLSHIFAVLFLSYLYFSSFK